MGIQETAVDVKLSRERVTSNRCHSYLRVSIGSTLEARRAGRRAPQPAVDFIKVCINNILMFVELTFDKIKCQVRSGKMDQRKWTDWLSEDDLAFLKRFVLSSGSLKELARVYGVSYPTVRLRLDRLIEKVKILDNTSITSDFERLLRTLFAEGKMDIDTLNAVLAAQRKSMEEKK